MQQMTGLMKTDRPERYAKQLVSHWAARGPVVDEADGLVQRWTTGQVIDLRPTDEGLVVRISVPAGEDVTAFADVVATHLQRFGKRDELTVEWSDSGA